MIGEGLREFKDDIKADPTFPRLIQLSKRARLLTPTAPPRFRRAVVPRTGLEPVRLAAPDFKSGTSTNFVTRASGGMLSRAFLTS